MKLSIRRCARCGEDHIDLDVKPFTRPVLDDGGNVIANAFALCPINAEPILVSITKK